MTYLLTLQVPEILSRLDTATSIAEITKLNKALLLTCKNQMDGHLFKDESLYFIPVIFDMLEMKFLTVGVSCKTILGYDPVEMEGRFFGDFLADPAEVEKGKETVNKNINEGEPAKGHLNHYRHKNGGLVKLSWTSNITDGKTSLSFAMPIAI